MHKTMRPSAIALCLALSAGIPHLVLAAPPASEAGRKEEAKKHFESGRELDAKGDVPGALREFFASRSIFKTRGNTLNAALALRKLGRIGEALDLLEAYLKDFENLSPEDKAMVEGEIAATAQFVGKLAIETTTSGFVMVDGVVRGKTPQAESLRLSAGTHSVRVQPESFAARPFEATVSIVAQQVLQLKPEFGELRQHGGLTVKAADGGTFDVLLDGTVVGTTPLSLQVVPRDYTVSLRSADGSGSAPARATVVSGREHEMSLPTLKLDAQVELQVEPPDATVFLDGVPVGRGTWRGATTRGQHDFRAEAPGFTPRTLRATLAAPDQSLSLELKRGADDPADAAVGTRTGFGGFAELDLGVSVGLVAGGHIRGECDGNCTSSVAFGPKGALRGGLTIDKRFELGTELTFLHMPEHIEQRADTVSVVGRNTPANGISNDVVKWNSIGMGAVGGVRLGPVKTPITLRLAAGVMVGSVSDRRNGTFDAGAGPELAQATRTVQAATHFYLAPEVRAGYAFTDRFSAGIGVRGTFAFDLSVPRWDTRRPTVLAGSGLAYWDGGAGSGRAGERILGGVRVLLDPSVYVRYDF